MKVDWKDSNPDIFQNFCNSLLWMELGNSFQGFEAPGKDQGIDGSFSGKYQRKAGLWRFQYKFHGTARKTGFNSLKKDVVSEIKKIKTENHLVILTNVCINPSETREIIDLATQTLCKEEKTHTIFKLWDGSKLNRLYLKYPILKVWMEEGFTTSTLLPYKVAFERQLQSFSHELDTLSNFFVSRQDELEKLKEYVSNEDQYLAVITGETGIGKTRLAVHFFQQYIDSSNKWIVLKVDNYNINFDRIKFALSASYNYILLVDDAQNFTARSLADLKRLGGKNGSFVVKIIFTIRSLETMDSLKFIRELELEKALSISLDKLSKEDTKAIFEKELSNEILINFVDQLVDISRGRPILIVGILNAASKKENITTIKNQAGFNNYVIRHFDTFIDKVVKDTGIEKLKARNLLSLICLIEPFNYADSNVIQEIIKNESLNEEFVSYFLRKLIEVKISSGHYQKSIKPDYYSDIVLAKAVTDSWIKRKLDDYKDFTNNILINLASIDDLEKDRDQVGDSLLDSLLMSYIRQLRSLTHEDFNDRLRLIYTIASQKPNIAEASINILLSLMQESNKSSKESSRPYEGKKRFYNDLNSPIIKGILHDLLYHPEYYAFSFNATIQLFKLTDDKSIFESTFSYNHATYLYQYTIQCQKYFVKRAGELMNDESENENENTTLFIIHGLSELLKLSFTSARRNIYDDYSIRVFTHYIPSVTSIQAHRLSIVNLLKDYYSFHKNEKIRLATLKVLLDIPREISASNRSGIKYKNDDEIKIILDFLEEEGAAFTIPCKKEVLSELFWYRKQRIPKDFYYQLDTIEKVLQPRSLVDQALQLLVHLDTLPSEDDKHEKDTIRRFIENNSAEELSSCLSDLYNSGSELPNHFNSLIETIYNEFLFKAQKIYSILNIINKDFIYWYGSSFLRAFRAIESLNDFFWLEIQKYLDEGSSKSDNLLLNIYCVYWIRDVCLEKRDAEVIKKIFTRQSSDINSNLARALPTLYLIDKTEGERCLKEFLQFCTQKEAESLFRLLTKELKVDSFLSHLVFNYSIRFSISHEIEHCLAEYSLSVNADGLFSYFTRRFNYKMKLDNSLSFRYDFVPIGNHTVFAKKIDRKLAYILFKKAVYWAAFLKGDWQIDHAARNLVAYLKPAHEIDEDLKVIYIDIYEKCRGNLNAVEKIVKTISEFHNKTADLVALVSHIAEDAVLRLANTDRNLDNFMLYASEAITASGGKSGTPGKPFPFDVRLKELIEGELPKYEGRPTTYTILRTSLLYVNKNIAREMSASEEEW